MNLADFYRKDYISALFNTMPTTPKTIRLLLTCHDRPKMAAEAYASALAAGFYPCDITCCITGKTGMERLMKQWDARGTRVATYIGRHANDAWLQELGGMRESHVVILHDDDKLHKATLQTLTDRDDWDAAVWECRSFGGSTWQSSYWKAAEGVYDGEVGRQVGLGFDRPPSLVQACWPRQLLIDAFSWWRARCGSQFDIRAGMPIGNDLRAWYELGKVRRLLVLHEPLSDVRHHPGSTTVRGIADGTIDQLYEGVRKLCGFRRRKMLAICHLYREGRHQPFLQNLDDHRPDQPLLVMSDRPIPSRPHRVIYDHGEAYSPLCQNAKGTCAFAEAVQIVLDDPEITDLLYVEPDCRFGASGWDTRLWQEHLGNRGVRCSGSPVMWGVLGQGGPSVMKVVDYAHRYQQQTGLALAFEGGHAERLAIYPNGALAIYTRELLQQAFGDGMALVGLPEYCASIPAYDLHIGHFLAQEGVASALAAVGWLRSAYSGCGDHQYSLDARLAMLRQGDIVAIHQVKTGSKLVQGGCVSQTAEDQRLKNQVL